MKKVLISAGIHPAGMAVLAGKVEPVVMPDASPETAKRLIADCAGMILRTNLKMTAEIMDAASGLKVISRTGVGVDNVDVEAATARGILVCHTPGANSGSVAEQTLALILGTAKRLSAMDRAVRTGNWKARNENKTVDLEGKTLGIIGVGRIGALVARKCRAAFNMTVIAYDPFVKEADGIELCATPEEVFSRGDFISLHVPYTKETHHLVDAKLIGLMKREAILINTARGALVDEKALAAALRAGAVAGAGLDVFEAEPPAADNPLWTCENVIATPHAAALTTECVRNVAVQAAQAVVDRLEGREPEFAFNKKDLGKGGC